jgi:hypothetical protein
MNRDQLDRAVVDRLVGLFGGDERRIARWLRRPVKTLGGRPREVWRGGDAAAVLDFLNAALRRRRLASACGRWVN